MTLEQLFAKYKETREFKNLAPSSQLIYTNIMRRAVDVHFRAYPRINMITETTVDNLYAKLLKEGKHTVANELMRVCRRAFSVARRHGWIERNPFKEMGIKLKPPREVVWTEYQVKKFINTAIEKQQYGIACVTALCYYLAQRPGDMMALTHNNFDAGITEVVFRQRKTGKKMTLPVIPELAKYVKAAFAEYGGKTYTKGPRMFNIEFREIKTLAGIPSNLQIRDLRRTALVEFMERGATDAEGQSWSGHSNRDMLNTYAPATKKMAINAMQKRFVNEKLNLYKKVLALPQKV